MFEKHHARMSQSHAGRVIGRSLINLVLNILGHILSTASFNPLRNLYEQKYWKTARLFSLLEHCQLVSGRRIAR
ncbi:MAG: hypothetical protein ACU83P_02640, partial [Gammaproteobacteria bacterium]